MWRANRIVDCLAKMAAGHDRIPRWVMQQVADAAKLVQYSAAKLGAVTHAANNLSVTVVVDGGATVTRTVRDSTAERPAKQHRNTESQQPLPTNSAQEKSLVASAPTVVRHDPPDRVGLEVRAPKAPRKLTAHSASRTRKRAAGAAAEQLRQDAAAEAQVANWRANLELAPAKRTDSAQDRLDTLKARAAAKHVHAKHGTGVT